ncbi:MAG TPA: ATP-binding protein [Chryseolinea sp.]|nr:ATP-binding protein [Chryseolinea sp.]
MKTKFLLFFLFTFPLLDVSGQIREHEIAKLKKDLSKAVSDSVRIHFFIELSNGYRFSNIDSALTYVEKAIELSRRVAQPVLEGEAISQRGYIFLEAGDIPKALQDQFLALNIAKNNGALSLEALTLNRIGNTYMELRELRKAIDYYRLSKNLFAQIKDKGFVHNEISNIGNVYEMMGILDSAKSYQQQVFKYSLTNTDRYTITYGEMRERLGNVEKRLGNYDSAIVHYRFGVREALTDNDYRNMAANYLQLAGVFETLHQYDSGVYYAKRTIDLADAVLWRKGIYDASGKLARMYKLKHQLDSALKYAELNIAIRDSLLGPKQINRLQLVMLSEQERQLQLEKEKDDLQYRYRTIALSAVIGIFLLLAIILWRNNIRKQETNRRLSEQRDQIAVHRNDLEKTLIELKGAQAQLIQSEKMASLGELTAGIAHEIQNPLNFVNNFSEVNEELLSELKDELSQGTTDDAISLVDNAIENQKKINHHGKRADAIVKGMLQHSRASSGTEEPTDINALCDEYLRLSYHGLRAKDKSFNARFETSFDSTLEKINVIPQDIGRVILNLINNAFYAVAEKQKQNLNGFEPTVSVSTKVLNARGKVEIKVADNGNGIPDHLKEKIFQPFFTTKPTGQGTGLGLSLSYDIIRAHGGEIKVKSHEGKGSEFIIQLPEV